MHLLHLAFLHVPVRPHRCGRCVRNNERVKDDSQIAKAGLNLLNGFMKLDFWICRTDVSDALWVHEDYMLFAVRDKSEDKVRVEITGFEKSDPTALAEAA